MKYIILFILFLMLLWQFDFKIRFTPFSIKVGDWMTPVATVLLAIALLLFRYKAERDGYRAAIEDILKMLHEQYT